MLALRSMVVQHVLVEPLEPGLEWHQLANVRKILLLSALLPGSTISHDGYTFDINLAF